MDLKNNPKAYWSFQTNSLKEDVRDIINSIACNNLKLQSPYTNTPWRINLFRIEEFEEYLGASEQYEKLNPLRGWEGPNEVSYLLSDSDMLISYFAAQRLLKEDSHLEKFIKKSKDKNLNYVIQSTHNGSIQSCAYNGSISIFNFLIRLNLDLHNTQIGYESNDFRNQLYGFFENSEKSDFKIMDCYGNEMQ